jgi:hypothetical protein
LILPYLGQDSSQVPQSFTIKAVLEGRGFQPSFLIK